MLLKPCALIPSSSSSVTLGLPHEVSSAPVASNEFPRFHPGCMAATGASGSLSAGVVAPPHVVPLRVNVAGTGFVCVQAPVNPKLTVAPPATVPFQEALTAVTAVPFWATVAFQAWFTL